MRGTLPEYIRVLFDLNWLWMNRERKSFYLKDSVLVAGPTDYCCLLINNPLWHALIYFIYFFHCFTCNIGGEKGNQGHWRASMIYLCIYYLLMHVHFFLNLVAKYTSLNSGEDRCFGLNVNKSIFDTLSCQTEGIYQCVFVWFFLSCYWINVHCTIEDSKVPMEEQSKKWESIKALND